MAGIYIHIPYCRKACHYCDFHFSTVLKTKGTLVQSIINEIELRKHEVSVPVQTIYFGGGTPSILLEEELAGILSALQRTFTIDSSAEITLEANPEDINHESLMSWKKSGVNRLSIGIQSFNDEILSWMNRNHTAAQSISSVKLAQDIGLTNISIDVIYGVHSRTLNDWEHELKLAAELNTPHISAYCLTVEEKTVFHKHLKKGKPITHVDEEVEQEFYLMLDKFSEAEIGLYEISNFSKQGFESKHNSNYWAGVSYLGLGPGAHSFDGVDTRSWNVSNNTLYIKGIENGMRSFEQEVLSLKERYNESVMTGLRRKAGIDLSHAQKAYNVNVLLEYDKELIKYTEAGLIKLTSDHISLTKKGFMMADRIASEFFA